MRGEMIPEEVPVACYPIGGGSAPEDVVFIKIERKLPGNMMGYDSLVNVNCSLWTTRGATGEV
jgi:hypothetical protein